MQILITIVFMKQYFMLISIAFCKLNTSTIPPFNRALDTPHMYDKKTRRRKGQHTACGFSSVFCGYKNGFNF